MSDTLDRLEILIGKFLDGELAPQERSLLETELQRDGHAKELFEQMRLLHECSCGVVTHEVLGRGADPAEIFERAWQQNKKSFWRRIAQGGLQRQGWRWGARTGGYVRFAVGIAAGLLLGLFLPSVPLLNSQTPSAKPSPPLVAVDVPSGGNGQIEMGSPVRSNGFGASVVPVHSPANPRQVTRKVNWYIYTDRNGNQWLIEGTEEGMVKPAVHRDIL
jgi:anti-sigma factor RsiW